MRYDGNKFYGLLCAGLLHEAMDYLAQFPQKRSQHKKLLKRYESSDDTLAVRTKSEVVNSVLRAFFAYYKDVLWRNVSKDDANARLYESLLKLVDRDELLNMLAEDFDDAKERIHDFDECYWRVEELIQNAVEAEGYQFLGGMTQGYFGPYIWKRTKPTTFAVELPVGSEKLTVQMMEGFVSRSWLDYVSLGRIGSGGWQTTEELFCVKKSYAWRIHSDRFQISFLKHETQHLYDRIHYPEIPPVMLEYRAKLCELMYYSNLSCFGRLYAEASDHDPDNSHAYASYLIMRNLSKLIFGTEKVPDFPEWKSKHKDIVKFARVCYDDFEKQWNEI